MNLLDSLRDAPFFQRLGWALVAFLWQGALVGGLLAALQVVLRRARPQVRYAFCCATLLVMLVLPAATFLRAPSDRLPISAPTSSASFEASAPLAAARLAISPERHTAGSLWTEIRRRARPMAPSLAGLWLLGVLLLSARFLAGWKIAESLRRTGLSAAPEDLRSLTTRVARRLAVSRPVLLFQSAAVSVPAALGVFKPVILLPVSAVSGLSPEEIEAVLAHELAHIARHDYLVNLIQTAAETLLFYHPAVWWVSRQIRAERENCCDDLAVAATGDSRVYVRALLGLESLRGARPQLAVAATGGSLWSRVARLFPSTASPAERVSHSLAGVLALAILCALGAAAGISAREASILAPPIEVPSIEVPARLDRAAEKRERSEPAGRPADGVEGGVPGDVRGGVVHAVGGGVKGGVKGGTAGGIRGGVAGAADDNAVLSPDQRDAFRIHGVTPEFVSAMRELLGALSPDQCLSLRIHGVTPDFVRGFQQAGYSSLSADQAVALRIHGVRSEDAAALTDGSRKPTLDDLVSARIHGVTPGFAGEMRSLGFPGDLDTLVSLRIHGVTPEFARAIHSLGYKPLSADEALSMRIHGVTPEFIRQANQSAGDRLSIDELVGLRIHGRGRR